MDDIQALNLFVDKPLLLEDKSDILRSKSFYNNVYAPSTPPAKGAMRCLYKTGKCMQIRAMKRNKQYHRLCQYHRNKANSNQRKLDRKKKEKKGHSRVFKRSISEDMPYDASEHQEVVASKRPSIIAPAEAKPELWSLDELEMLESCLDTKDVLPEEGLQQRFSAVTTPKANIPPLMRSMSLPAYDFEPFKV